MRTLVTVLYVLTAVVNLIPVVGVISAERLSSLYGIPVDGADLTILLRHRAVLFGIVGALLMGAAFHVPLRPVAIGAGVVSMLSFVVIAYMVGDFNAALRRVVFVDIGALVLLALAAVLGER